MRLVVLLDKKESEESRMRGIEESCSERTTLVTVAGDDGFRASISARSRETGILLCEIFLQFGFSWLGFKR